VLPQILGDLLVACPDWAVLEADTTVVSNCS
jgi:hypothetical protein